MTSTTWQKGIRGGVVIGYLLMLCGMAAAQPGPGTPPSAPPPTSRLTTVPIDYDTVPFEGRDTGLALVPLVLEGHLRRFFLIDTGTTFFTASGETAKALGLTPQPTDGPVVIDGRRADFVNVSSVKAEDANMDFHGQFAVMTNSALRFVPGMP